MPDDGTLSPEIAEIFLSQASARTFVAGQRIFDLGSNPACMFGILSGAVRVSLEPMQLSERLSLVLGPGQWFGEVPLLDARARAFSAVAHGRSKIAVVSTVAFNRVIASNPAALLAITRLVCSRYRQTLNWIEANQARSLERRLAAQLLTAQPSIRMPQSALADRLGVSRPTVNRLLKAWKAQGLIDVGYGKVNVLNMDALAAILAGERAHD